MTERRTASAPPTGRPMDETRRLARHNVVGVSGTLDESKAALAAGQDVGFDVVGELSLLGPDHEVRPALDHVQPALGEGATGTAEGLVKGRARVGSPPPSTAADPPEGRDPPLAAHDQHAPDPPTS